MVDFNNETTVGTPALEVVKILILQRRYDVFEALEAYNKAKYKDQEADISLVKARLMTLFFEIQAGLKRRLKEEEYKKLLSNLESDEEGPILQAIYTINEELDNINLTKIDLRKKFDTSLMLKENKIKGL